VAPHIASDTRIGCYRVDARLGDGGMGIVYRATDTRLNRPVAIKFLANALLDAVARGRFQREAQIASGLNHPHILTVHDVGDHEGRQYIVSELIDGGTLDDWARKRGPLSWRQVVELLVGVADGLAAAHAAKILHRDVKPANILISEAGYAKLADFGLAKLASVDDAAAPGQGASYTAVGVVVGTVAYMSPEQAAGKTLDARSDIFSFGVVLYELLCGHRPFVGDTELQVLKAIAHSAAAPVDADIPEPLRLIVEKALEHNADERYQSMRELVVDMRRILRQKAREGPTVSATNTSHHRWRLATQADGGIALRGGGRRGSLAVAAAVCRNRGARAALRGRNVGDDGQCIARDLARRSDHRVRGHYRRTIAAVAPLTRVLGESSVAGH